MTTKSALGADHIARSLLNAGIGKRFHSRTLDSLPEASAAVLKPWFKSQAKQELAEGRGWTLVGATDAAYDAAILLSRAVHLAGQRTRVLTLRRLIANLGTGSELEEECEHAQVLTLLDFFQLYPGNPTPLTGREVQQVEEFLNERLDEQRPLILHCAKPLAGETWYSTTLLARIAGVNRKLEVA